MMIKSYVDKHAVVNAIKAWVFGASPLELSTGMTNKVESNIFDLPEEDVIPVEFIREWAKQRPGYFSTAANMIINDWHCVKSGAERVIDEYLGANDENKS